MNKIAAILVGMFVCACGGGEAGTAPPPVLGQPDFSAGLKLVTFQGWNGPMVQSLASPCTGPGVLGGGAIFLQTRVDLEPAGPAWVAKSSPATDGDLELDLQVASGPGPNDRVVSGTAIGLALTFSGRRERAMFDTSRTSVIAATGNQIGTEIDGWVTGPITFEGPTGVTFQCDEAAWTMSPLPAILAGALAP